MSCQTRSLRAGGDDCSEDKYARKDLRPKKRVFFHEESNLKHVSLNGEKNSLDSRRPLNVG